MSKITVTVSGETGSGKSAIAGEIEIALKAIGVPVEWKDADREWWQKGNEYWIDLYKPEVTIIEQNLPIQAPRPDPQELGMQKRFYGAECRSYPNCTGGCGLGCTYEIVNRPPPHLRHPGDQ